MAINPRLAAKLDDAVRALKPRRKAGFHEGTHFVETLRTLCAIRLPFTLTLGDAEHRILPDDIRVSGTRIDFGPIVVRLGSMAPWHHYDEDEDGKSPVSVIFSIPDEDDRHVPIRMVRETMAAIAA